MVYFKEIIDRICKNYQDYKYKKELSRIDRIVKNSIYVVKRDYKIDKHVEYIVYRYKRFTNRLEDTYIFSDFKEAKDNCDYLRKLRKDDMIRDMRDDIYKTKVIY